MIGDWIFANVLINKKLGQSEADSEDIRTARKYFVIKTGTYSSILAGGIAGYSLAQPVIDYILK